MEVSNHSAADRLSQGTPFDPCTPVGAQKITGAQLKFVANGIPRYTRLCGPTVLRSLPRLKPHAEKSQMHRMIQNSMRISCTTIRVCYSLSERYPVTSDQSNAGSVKLGATLDLKLTREVLRCCLTIAHMFDDQSVSKLFGISVEHAQSVDYGLTAEKIIVCYLNKLVYLPSSSDLLLKGIMSLYKRLARFALRR